MGDFLIFLFQYTSVLQKEDALQISSGLDCALIISQKRQFFCMYIGTKILYTYFINYCMNECERIYRDASQSSSTYRQL